MSLRERKKVRQRSEIIATSISLFRATGPDAVRVQEIARRAEISEATFFNYFRNKDAVLGEWAQAQVAAAFERAGESGTESNLRRPVRELVAVLAGEAERDADFWGQAWSRARLARPVGRGAREPAPPALGLLERAQRRGEIRGDVPAEQMAELLEATIHATLARWLATPPPERSEALAPRLQRAVDLVLDGCRKRNERVRAASGAA